MNLRLLKEFKSFEGSAGILVLMLDLCNTGVICLIPGTLVSYMVVCSRNIKRCCERWC